MPDLINQTADQFKILSVPRGASKRIVQMRFIQKLELIAVLFPRCFDLSATGLKSSSPRHPLIPKIPTNDTANVNVTTEDVADQKIKDVFFSEEDADSIAQEVRPRLQTKFLFSRSSPLRSTVLQV